MTEEEKLLKRKLAAKLWRKKNPEKVRAWQKKNYEKNKEKRQQYFRAYYASNRERFKEKGKKWKEKNPEKVKASARKSNQQYRLLNKEIINKKKRDARKLERI